MGAGAGAAAAAVDGTASVWDLKRACEMLCRPECAAVVLDSGTDPSRSSLFLFVAEMAARDKFGEERTDGE